LQGIYPDFLSLLIMPIYEYECQQGCSETYEVWRTIDNRSTNIECPKCGEDGRRVFSPPMTLSSSLRLKIENKEPQVIRKEKRNTNNNRLKSSDARPWMLNRGC